MKPPKRKRRKQRKRDAAARLRRSVQQEFPEKEVIVDQAYEGAKMSDVLKAFIAPFYPLVEGEEAFQKLLAIAVAAWNIALFPARERAAQIQMVLEALPQDVHADARAIIGDLVARKEAHFSQYRRLIVDYEVTDVGEDYGLTVLSMAHELEEGSGQGSP